mgnify:CR=1 FL=1
MMISVIGGGYVGLVSSVCFAELGHSVNLVEIDEEKTEAINAAIPCMHEKGLEELLLKYVGTRLKARSDYSCVAETDISFLCVGTPSSGDGSPDLTMIESACRMIGTSLDGRVGRHTIVVKSTVPPGTTENRLVPLVMGSSNKMLSEMGFAVNPEFLREGLAIQDFLMPDRIVIGSSDKAAGDAVEAAYRGLDLPIIRTTMATAEMIKYASNAFLAAKISFSNEIGNICKRLGIDAYDVLRCVGMDHRIGPHFLNAGVGFGGSCFPKDVAALISLAEGLGESTSMLRAIMDVNERQPFKIIELLEQRAGDLMGKRIAVLGLAFKNDTDDIRDSRSIPVIRELKRRGALVAAYDPQAIRNMRKVINGIDYCNSAAEALRMADACLVMTEWPEFGELDDEFDLMSSRIIIEGRRVLCCDDSEGICW